MQVGMIGFLGRMGGNMVRRLFEGRPPVCGLQQIGETRWPELVKKKAVSTTSLPDFVKKNSAKPRASLADGADRRR